MGRDGLQPPNLWGAILCPEPSIKELSFQYGYYAHLLVLFSFYYIRYTSPELVL